MSILITGGAGFIGSHLAEAYLQKDRRVSVIDDLSTGKFKNIEHLKNNSKFEYEIDSVLNKKLMAELVDKADIIFHLAAAVGVELIVESPVRTIETNIKGTEIVLKLANKKNKKVILASTSEVYGKGDDIPFSETSDLVMGSTDKGRWSYACSKAIDEFLGIAYWKEKGLPVVVARLFNTIGSRQTGEYGMVVPTFINQALNDDPLTVYGDGQQTRCFTYIKDTVKALMLLAESKDATGEVFNIGNDEEITIENLARKIIEMTGSNSELKYIPYSEAYDEGFEDMKRRVPDVSKLRKYTGFRPDKTTRYILKKIISHFKNGREDG